MSGESDLELQVQAMVRKADRALVAARRHVDAGDYDFASSRAYYAVFYVLEALLLTKGLTFSKHSSVISAFSQHFITPGAFPKEFSKLISRLFRERQAGDYEAGLSIEPEDARQDVQIAERMVEAITSYLRQERFLPPGE